MKRVLVAGALAGFMLAGATAAVAGPKPGHGNRPAAKVRSAGKTLLCHRGHLIRVGNAAVAAHVRHGDLVGSCSALRLPGRFELRRAALTPVAGATGRGTAVIGIGVFRGRTVLCYAVHVKGVSATAAHIHTAVAQTIGTTSFAANAIVVALKTPNARGVARGCMVVSRTTAHAILSTPGNFYVNVHSAAFPNGQVQGTLSRPAAKAPTKNGSDHHVKAPLKPVAGSGVTGFVQLTALPHEGTNIHVHAIGLTSGVTYASFYYESSDCTGEHDLLGTFTANAAGIGNVHGKADEDLDEIGSVSVRTPDYTTALFACATVG